MNNQTELINEMNQNILTITYSIIINPCLNKDCGNGISIQSNQT